MTVKRHGNMDSSLSEAFPIGFSRKRTGYRFLEEVDFYEKCIFSVIFLMYSSWALANDTSLNVAKDTPVFTNFSQFESQILADGTNLYEKIKTAYESTSVPFSSFDESFEGCREVDSNNKVLSNKAQLFVGIESTIKAGNVPLDPPVIKKILKFGAIERFVKLVEGGAHWDGAYLNIDPTSRWASGPAECHDDTSAKDSWLKSPLTDGLIICPSHVIMVQFTEKGGFEKVAIIWWVSLNPQKYRFTFIVGEV